MDSSIDNTFNFSSIAQDEEGLLLADHANYNHIGNVIVNGNSRYQQLSFRQPDSLKTNSTTFKNNKLKPVISEKFIKIENHRTSRTKNNIIFATKIEDF